MYLKRFIYINWGSISEQEFELGPVNLFSGGNGSGKTTAADAIQTIMTAAHDNLFAFNPGQEETTQRGRGGKQMRTLGSYVLGCDDGSYTRPWDTDGYIAAVFHPTKGEASEPFSAVIANRAHLEVAGQRRTARITETLFLIIPNEELLLTHLVHEFKDGRHIVPLDRVYNHCRELFGKSAVEKYETKKAYLARLYGALRGKRDAVTQAEAMAAAKAFSGFMAYKPEKKGINHFVANEILEKKDHGEIIHSITNLMRNIYAMERDAGRLKELVNILVEAAGCSRQYIDHWLDWNRLQYAAALSRYRHNQQQYLQVKREQKRLRETLVSNEQEIKVNEQRKQKLRQRTTELEARRLGIPALRDKDDYEQVIQKATEQLQYHAVDLLKQDQQLQDNLSAAQTISRSVKGSCSPSLSKLLSKSVIAKTAAALIKGQTHTPDIQQLVSKDWVDISAMEAQLTTLIELQQHHQHLYHLLHDTSLGTDSPPKAEQLQNPKSIRDEVAAELHQTELQLQSLRKQTDRKQKEIEILQSQRTPYPGFVQQALDGIRKQCPEADARVLCDYVEVLDETWQAAIEGYIGGARFAIIVAGDYEARAIQIVRKLSGRQTRARVIQGDKAQKDYQRLSHQLSKNSIVQIMSFDHAVARHFITASYGNVERVVDAEELRATRRGVTSNGMGSGNYSMFRCDMADSDLVFGQAARAKALLAKEAELQQLLQELQQLNDSYNAMQQLLKAVDKLKSLQYVECLSALMSTQRELYQAEEQLSQLDLSEFEEMEQQLQVLFEEENQLQDLIKQLVDSNGQIKNQLSNIESQAKSLSEQQDKCQQTVEQHEDNLRHIATLWTDFELEQCLLEVEQTAVDSSPEILQAEALTVTQLLDSGQAQLERIVLEHNQLCQTSDSLLFQRDYQDPHGESMFRAVCQLERQIDNLHNRLKNNILVEKHELLRQVKDSFHTAFVANFCHSIYQSINEGKRVLEDLNKELQHHRFGTDRESYRFSWKWVAEFKEYWKFFEEVVKHPQLGDGLDLSDLELSQASHKVKEKLMTMLLDEDEHKAVQELKRIADYRHYREYDIYKEPEGKEPIPLSEYGTGSGGQSETPFYIIRSAAVTSAFRFNEGSSHLRMVLVDEAFTRMDETRSREVINYLTEQLGLQLIFIMPTSKTGPLMDLISNQFVFAKCPSSAPVGELNTQVFIDRQQINREQIQTLWENHKRTIRHQGALDFMEEFQ